MIIDVHVHPFCKEATITPSLEEGIRRQMGTARDPARIELATTMLTELFTRRSVHDIVKEMDAAGVDKAEALRFVAHRLGIDLSRLAYVGDSGNDVTALELVDRAGGLCFSMKNATASALRACPRRTGTDNEHGGAAEVLQLLQPQAAPSGQ